MLDKFTDATDECGANGVNHGVFYVSIKDDSLNSRNIADKGKKVVNVDLCAYFGLEVEKQLQQKAIDDTKCFGTQYSALWAFSACSLYEKVENIFYNTFGKDHVILAATTTLTDIEAMPSVEKQRLESQQLKRRICSGE